MRERDVRKTYRALTITALTIFCTVLFSACGADNAYRHLSMEDAVQMMQSEKDYLIVDVRSKEEYDKRHIPGAILLPIDDIRAGKTDVLSDQRQTLLLYCWTGRRAEDAAILLAKMGYQNVYEFGGLVDWRGETEGEE